MVVQSHLYLASILNKELNKNGYKVNKKNFYYGNIKPDIIAKFKKHPHKITSSLDFIMEEIQNLSTFGNIISLKEFSIQLGVICHYVTDFFTYVHNSDYHGSLSKHLKYELKLNTNLKTMVKDLSRANIFIMPNISKSIKEFKNYLLKMHDKYMNEEVTFIKDFSYAIAACTSLCLTVFSLLSAINMPLAMS